MGKMNLKVNAEADHTTQAAETQNALEGAVAIEAARKLAEEEEAAEQARKEAEELAITLAAE